MKSFAVLQLSGCAGARGAIVRTMGTPLTDQYLVHFRQSFGAPAHAILLYDLCRGIELVYAIERALKATAKRCFNTNWINLELDRAVGRVVRAFDPCIACATH